MQDAFSSEFCTFLYIWKFNKAITPKNKNKPDRHIIGFRKFQNESIMFQHILSNLHFGTVITYVPNYTQIQVARHNAN